MASSFKHFIETVANLLIIIVASLLCVVLVREHRLTMSPAVSPKLGNQQTLAAFEPAAIGTNFKDRLPGVDWSRNGRTLVLAMSTHCHFCTESIPFFRSVKEQLGNTTKVVAVLPESSAEAEAYLKANGLQVDQIKQATLGRVGARGTPTVFLVSDAGLITKVWVGKLQPQEQEQMLSALVAGAVRSTKGG